MLKSILACLAALALLAMAAPSGARAEGDRDARRREEVVERVKKARAENRRVEVNFNNTVTLTGRVGEVHEKGFTFEPDNKDDAAVLHQMDMVAAVLYQDVASVRYPSKARKFFRGVRMGFIGAGTFFIVMPIYGVQALLGNLPEC